jgi:hypothetical protein
MLARSWWWPAREMPTPPIRVSVYHAVARGYSPGLICRNEDEISGAISVRPAPLGRRHALAYDLTTTQVESRVFHRSENDSWR